MDKARAKTLNMVILRPELKDCMHITAECGVREELSGVSATEKSGGNDFPAGERCRVWQAGPQWRQRQISVP